MPFSSISTCLNISAIHFKQTNNVCEGEGETISVSWSTAIPRLGTKVAI